MANSQKCALCFAVAILASHALPCQAKPITAPRSVAIPHSEIPWDRIPESQRDQVRRIVANPTLTTQGPAEMFRGSYDLYRWLMDHPDQGVLIWRKLGAKCVEIKALEHGRFGWKDGRGGYLNWQTVHDAPGLRIWLAEGKARPAPLMPEIPINAVVVLRYQQRTDVLGRSWVAHQAELFGQTDNTAANLMTCLLGPSAPYLARQCVSQLEMFFSALCWYVDEHPQKAEQILLGPVEPTLPSTRKLQQLLAHQIVGAPNDNLPILR